MKKRLKRGSQARQSQREMEAEIDRRILAELQLQEHDPQWNRVRASLLEYPSRLRGVRDAVIGRWLHSIADALPDDQTLAGDVLTNDQVDRLLQQTIQKAMPEILRDLREEA